MDTIKIEGDRIVAFLIIDGKAYSSDCDHQDCLEAYYKDKGIKSEFDYSNPNEFDKVQAKAIKKTYAMKETHQVYGFDLFDTSYGYILVAHDEETLRNNTDFVKQYLADNSSSEIKPAYFVSGYDAVICEDTYQ